MVNTETIPRQSEDDKVFEWRLESFKRLGFKPDTAEWLASDFSVSLDLARKLIEAGCSPELAARIV